jgi:hypothetical protein
MQLGGIGGTPNGGRGGNCLQDSLTNGVDGTAGATYGDAGGGGGGGARQFGYIPGVPGSAGTKGNGVIDIYER